MENKQKINRKLSSYQKTEFGTKKTRIQTKD